MRRLFVRWGVDWKTLFVMAAAMGAVSLFAVWAGNVLDEGQAQECLRRWGGHAQHDRHVGCLVRINDRLVPEKNVVVKIEEVKR